MGGDGTTGTRPCHNNVYGQQRGNAHARATSLHSIRRIETSNGAVHQPLMDVDSPLSSDDPTSPSHPVIPYTNMGDTVSFDGSASDAIFCDESEYYSPLPELPQLHGHRYLVLPLASSSQVPPNIILVHPGPVNRSTREIEEALEVMRETRIEITVLKDIKVIVFNDKYAKKYILICPQNLVKTSLDIRRPFNPHVRNYVLIMNPMVTDQDSPSTTSSRILAVGNVGGLAVLWDGSLLDLDEAATTDQEIHAIIKPYERAMEYQFLAVRYLVKEIHVQQQWCPPIDGLKLNIDGSYDHKSGSGGAGGIFRDSRGNWIKGFMKKISVKNSVGAEIRALYMGLEIAVQLKCSNIFIAIDSVMLATACNKDTEPSTNLILLCRGLLRKLGDPLVSHEEGPTNLRIC
ncbi:hypothetical protein FXO37_01077 [Capsicum annuum]|nr:hypothetical protein FXO37_01077 [Capsicum annuum]